MFLFRPGTSKGTSKGCYSKVPFSQLTRWGSLDFIKGATPHSHLRPPSASLSSWWAPTSPDLTASASSSGAIAPEAHGMLQISWAHTGPRTCQKECQNRCQKGCQKRCQLECQKICQRECQRECQIGCQSMSNLISDIMPERMPARISEYIPDRMPERMPDKMSGRMSDELI